MNLQGKLINGVWQGGIEWTRIREVSGFIRRGYTWNAIKGCRHGCAWQMPDGAIVECYAKGVAERLAQAAYPRGFAAHYFDSNALADPLSVHERAGIFMDSMADVAGAWVPAEERDQVLAVIREAGARYGHIFQLLTKAAPGLLRFDLPLNVWPGVSSPPDFFNEVRVGAFQRASRMERALGILLSLALENPSRVTWMSFEPVSYDWSAFVRQMPGALRWAVIGAGTNGSTVYDPQETHVRNLLEVLDQQGVPVFFKGNLRRAAQRWGLAWREEFPAVDTPILKEAA